MPRTIIVSNRLPVSIQKKEGEYIAIPSSGGLVSGLSSVYRQKNSVWVGWPGMSFHSRESKEYIRVKLEKDKMRPVFLSESLMDKFYSGFSNHTIWPLFHYFPKLTAIEEDTWDAYKKANLEFAEEILSVAEAGDTVWVHDYHLFLLPQILRRKMPELNIGFFLHIPFPSYEIFRILPPRIEILEGILGADLIGFQTYDDMRHFLSSVSRLLGIPNTNGIMEIGERTLKVDAFPIGIDYERYAETAGSDEVKKRVADLRTMLGKQRFLVSVDRLDLSKGITEKLKAFELFLEENPEYRFGTTLVMLVVPSRTTVPVYKALKMEIEQEIGRINGKFGRLEWTPVVYQYRSVSSETLSAYYCMSEVALITPLRDGMNLVSKEYVASRQDSTGVLILSEMAGSSKELSDALIVNPFDIPGTADAILKALTMPQEEQRERMMRMQERLKRSNVHAWARLFLQKLREIKEMNIPFTEKLLVEKDREKLLHDYRAAGQRIVFLDYDGTLVPFQPDPKNASPDEELLSILDTLSRDSKNRVVLISGRDRHTLGRWFQGQNIDIIAEHGVWMKKSGHDWELSPNVEDSWKSDFMPIFDDYVNRTPGTFIEEKDYSIVWHYRKADPEFGLMRTRELLSHLNFMISNHPLQVMEGNKVLELKHASINKGLAAIQWLKAQPYDFTMALGDDNTDEDLFRALSADAYSIKIGKAANTNANYALPSYREVRSLLRQLCEEQRSENRQKEALSEQEINE